MTTVEALRRCPLFKDFSEVGLRIFAGVARERQVPAGSPVFLQDAPGDGLVVLKSGTVRITRRSSEEERELATLGAGEHLGALALMGKGRRLVSAVAATPCEVVEISRADFVRLQPEKPQACLKLALAIGADLAARIADSRDLLRDLPARRPAER